MELVSENRQKHEEDGLSESEDDLPIERKRRSNYLPPEGQIHQIIAKRRKGTQININLYTYNTLTHTINTPNPKILFHIPNLKMECESVETFCDFKTILIFVLILISTAG